MATPHIQANKEDIAKIVLMPGDPKRAKIFAETYLENPRLINEVRGMLGYTGTFKGKEVTVMGHGMGLDSIGIYAYELYHFYDVETIIRFGSCGAYTPDLDLYDVIIAENCYSKSNYGLGFGYDKDTIEGTPKLVELAKKVSSEYEATKKVVTGTVNSSMWFYTTEDMGSLESFVSKGILAAEMEGYALYSIAKALGRDALVLLTVSDNIATQEETTSAERETGFIDMFNILLKVVEEL